MITNDQIDTSLMDVLSLNSDENNQINALLSKVMRQFNSPSDEQFLSNVKLYSYELPKRLLQKLNDLKYASPNGMLLIREFQIDDLQIGATPAQANKQIDEGSALRENFMLILLSEILGDTFGWSSQREGALINNVLPLKGHEEEQLSTGSMANLDWHTEEAFHDYRSDYLGLMCLRNFDGIPTLVASINDFELSREVKKILFQPRFIFHKDGNFDNGGLTDIQLDPVLFGDFNDPYVRIDPSFMQAQTNDIEAKKALTEIISKFNNSLREVHLKQGDILFIDNFLVVHGRKGFKPKFDGYDRWLKRANITLDIRKSRSERKDKHSRIIITN
jgi:hypothetical protein